MQAPEPVASWRQGAIAWMAQNPVAANLLMVVILVGGLLGLLGVKQEIFPEFDLDIINVTVPYPGASPAEVEQGIVLAVEEQVRGIDGVKRVTSVAAEGVGNVSVELQLGADANKVLADVKSAVDRIQSFPENAERYTVAIASRRRQVISLVISGDQPLRTLHEVAEKAREDLIASDDITQVDVLGVRPLEVSIEVRRQDLEAFGLSLEEVAAQVRAASVELPAGEIETRGGDLLVRLADRRVAVDDFANIVLKSTAKGGQVRLGDVATIIDDYADTDQAYFFNGKPAVRVTAYRVADETPIDVSNAVRAYAKELEPTLPKGIHLEVWNDDSEMLRARIDLLVRNARFGLVLVLVVLAMFLDLRLAGWVALGIPVSFMGAFVLMPFFDLSINMVTLFAFIITLGMVVDDAIVVGENIYAKLEAGVARHVAVIQGAKEMAVPVTFAVLTTLAAFAPLFFIPGVMGKIFRLIPAIVIFVLGVSLVESFFMLPAHLSHRSEKPPSRWVSRIEMRQQAFARRIIGFFQDLYRPALDAALRQRHIALAVAVALLVVGVSLPVSGIVPFTFFPKLEGDLVTTAAQLPYGAPLQATLEVQRKLEEAAQKTIEELGAGSVHGMFTRLGEGAQARGHGASESATGGHLVTIEVNLVPSDERAFSAAQFGSLWEKNTPPLAGLDSLVYKYSTGPGAGAAVDVQIAHANTEVLAKVSSEITDVLRGYDELTNVQNNYAAGKPQLDFHLRPQARTLGLTGMEVARQIRSAFYGAEALREQRGRNEVKVMVRLPQEQRQSEYDLESLLIRSPSGGYVPLGYVADFERSRSPTAIVREEGRRVVNVSAELAAGIKSARPVLEGLNRDIFPGLKARYSGLELVLVGQQREQNESFASLGPNFLFAMFVIFALLAVPFKSYLQPLIVMSVIPFGIVGAILGHMLMGYELSIISMLGIIALSGVVVNDSLVLIDATNTLRRSGLSPLQSITQGGLQRLRPIMLTSLTTFFGLAPMILETSLQARFLIPMAISLGFGILFATFIVLFLVPVLYMLLEDVRLWLGLAPAHAVLADEAPQDPHPLVPGVMN